MTIDMSALCEELGVTNTVRCVKHTAVRPNPYGRPIQKRVMDETFLGRPYPPLLLRLDEIRVAMGYAPRYLADAVAATGGELVSVSFNLRTNAGVNYMANSLANAASRPVVADYMALSEDTAAPAVTDTVLAGEITAGGLERGPAIYAHNDGAFSTSYTLSKTFAASSPFTSVRKEAIFNAAGPPPAGIIFLEGTVTPTAMVASDQLTITHTINF